MLWMRAADYLDHLLLQYATTEFVTHRPRLHNGPSMQNECDLLSRAAGSPRVICCGRYFLYRPTQPNFNSCRPSRSANQLEFTHRDRSRWADELWRELSRCLSTSRSYLLEKFSKVPIPLISPPCRRKNQKKLSLNRNDLSMILAGKAGESAQQNARFFFGRK